MSIRTITAADVDPVARLQTASIMAAGLPTYGLLAARAWARLGVEFRHQLLGNGAFFVAEQRSGNAAGLIGVGGWSPDGMETDLAWLRYLFVHPRAFRCGVGRRLLGTIEPSATRSGRSRLQVWSSLNAVPSYQANGYHRERIGRIPVQTGVELDYVLLSKRP